MHRLGQRTLPSVEDSAAESPGNQPSSLRSAPRGRLSGLSITEQKGKRMKSETES